MANYHQDFYMCIVGTINILRYRAIYCNTFSVLSIDLKGVGCKRQTYLNNVEFPKTIPLTLTSYTTPSVVWYMRHCPMIMAEVDSGVFLSFHNN